jgi:hypothetical protein
MKGEGNKEVYNYRIEKNGYFGFFLYVMFSFTLFVIWKNIL